MSGRGSSDFGRWHGRSRGRGSSRGTWRGSSRDASISWRSPRAISTPYGHPDRSSGGKRNLIGSTWNSTRHSSHPKSHRSSSVDRMDLNPEGPQAISTTPRQSVPNTSDELFPPNLNNTWSFSPGRIHNDNASVPQPWDESQGQMELSRVAALPAEQQFEVVMAVDVKEKGSLGCAYYDSGLHRFLLLQDMLCVEQLQLLEMLMVHIEPTMVLLPLKISDSVLRFFEQHQTTVNKGGKDKENYVLRTLGTNDFSYAASISKMANLPLIRPKQAAVTTIIHQDANGGVGDAHDEPQSIKAMRLGCFIDLDSILSIGCAGAVLGQTMRMHDTEQASGNPNNATVACLEMFNLSDFMCVNIDTLSSLQVFQPELHPNILMCGTQGSGYGSKESLSIYGILHPLAGSPQGRVKLRQILARPLANLHKIRERQASIAVFTQADNVEALRNVSRALRRINDIRRTLERLQKGADAQTESTSVDRGVWWTLSRFSLQILQLRDAVNQLRGAHDLAVVQQFFLATPVDTIKKVGELIGSVVDFDEAKANSRISVRWNVDSELDTLKQTYESLDSLLSNISDSISCELPDWARAFFTGCVFWPQLGFLTVVSLWSDNQKSGYEGEGFYEDSWERMFVADGKVYYKNRRMGELDARFGDTYTRIVDLEINILHKLASEVIVHAPTLVRAADACGELDCLVALANGAQRYRWTAPTMTEDNLINIFGGRHPLQELVVPSFIPNDCMLTGGLSDGRGRQTRPPANKSHEAHTLVLTGPNHSGKSVYVKQVALIVYLAHIGSFVPASHATIGITDQILTRISTRESVSQVESAFGTDLTQLAFLLKCATRRSLVIIDEFGKGTSADDGAGLMTGLIDHFINLDLHTPKALITTHFHEIFQNGCIQDCPGLSIAHMDVHLNLDASHIEDQVVCLYELAAGCSTSSFGSRCAALNGVNSAVVERSEAIVLHLARNEDLGAACAKLNAKDEERLEQAEVVARKFIQMPLQRLANTDLIQSSESVVDNAKFVRRTLQSLLAELVE